jgi:hypothetical protein
MYTDAVADAVDGESLFWTAPESDDDDDDDESGR